MSLILYLSREDLEAEYVNADIQLFEENMDEIIDFNKELEGVCCYGFESSMTYETAPIEVKTYLSVKYNTYKIYDISLCSPAMALKILQLRKGRVYAPYIAMNIKFIEYMTFELFDIEKATGVSGKYIKIKTIEELLREKRRNLASLINSEERISPVGAVVQNNSERTGFLDDIVFKKEIGGINVKLLLEFSSNAYGYIVGHTGDILHDVILETLCDREFIESKGERCELKYLDFANSYDEICSINSRAIAFTDNVFKILFSIKERTLVVIDNIDMIYFSSEELLKSLAEFIKSETKATYLVFSRLFSNYFTASDYIYCGEAKANNKDNRLLIMIRKGEDYVL